MDLELKRSPRSFLRVHVRVLSQDLVFLIFVVGISVFQAVMVALPGFFQSFSRVLGCGVLGLWAS